MFLRMLASAVLSVLVAASAGDTPALRSRVASSVSVIVGKVVDSPRRVPTPVAGGEHTPDWFDAPVRVSATLSGEHQEGVIRVAYSYNYDPAWDDAPKLRPGEEAIFLLHRFDEKEMQARVGNAFVVPRVEELLVIDRLDVQPLSERNRIALMRRSR